MAQKDRIYAGTGESVLSTTGRRTHRGGRRKPHVHASYLSAADTYGNVYVCNVLVPQRTLLEIQDDGYDMLTIIVDIGETFELSADAFTVLTGREWVDCIDYK